MKTGIFLDDERDVKDAFWMNYPTNVDWIVVRTFNEFVNVVRSNQDKEYFVSFDHDLQDFSAMNGRELTGYDCVKFLVDFCMQYGRVLPEAFYHTQNPIGKTNMECYMNNAAEFMSRS